MNTKNDVGLGLPNDWDQQDLISVYDNCPLRPDKTRSQSARWTVELESLRRGMKRLCNKCRFDKNP
jgi:hypothetical protein